MKIALVALCVLNNWASEMSLSTSGRIFHLIRCYYVLRSNPPVQPVSDQVQGVCEPERLNDYSESSQLGKHGFASLHNLTWAFYQNEGILLRHWRRFTNEVHHNSLHCFAWIPRQKTGPHPGWKSEPRPNKVNDPILRRYNDIKYR